MPECKSQGKKLLTHACQHCFEKKKQCSKPYPSWAKPVLGITRGIVHIYFYLFIMMLLTFPTAADDYIDFHMLPQRLDILDFRQKKMLCMLECLCDTGGIDMSMIPGFDDLPPHQYPTSPNNRSLSSPGLGVSGLALADTPPSLSSRSSSRAARPCECKPFHYSIVTWTTLATRSVCHKSSVSAAPVLGVPKGQQVGGRNFKAAGV